MTTIMQEAADCLGGLQTAFMRIVLLGIALLALIPVYLALATLIYPRISSVRHFPGPKPVSFWFGALPTMFGKFEIPSHCSIAWIQRYGRIVKVPAIFGSSRLIINDPVAINYVTQTKPYDFPRDEGLQALLTRLLGDGLLAAEGDVHRRQRRIVGPSFGQAHLRALYPTFYNIGQTLKDHWLDLIDQNMIDNDNVFPTERARREAYSSLKPDEVFIRVNKWLGRAAMDIIGECGFGCNFKSFSNQPNPLMKVFSINPCEDMKNGLSATVQILRELYVAWAPRLPFLAKILPFDSIIQRTREFVNLETSRILRAKRRMLEMSPKEARKEKDLMALLLHANLGLDKNKLSDEELKGQMSTFIIAGAETTTTALQWTLWRLAQNPEYQEKLRKEVWATREKNRNDDKEHDFTVQDIDDMPFLDAITREVLRFDPPVTQVNRIAGVNDRIPLLEPVKGTDGKIYTSIPIQKGTGIYVSVLAYNTDKRIWGEDADQFRPERWLDEKNLQNKLQNTCGIYSNMLTFWAGSHGCIGYKFALMEYKTILSILIDQFQFGLREPNMKLRRMARIVQQPFIKGEEYHGPGMPLRVSIARSN